MHSVRQQNHPQRNEALAQRFVEFRAQFDHLSEPELGALAEELIAHVERMGAPLDKAAKRDMRRYLDEHRDALITLGSLMTFTAGLSFGAGTIERVANGDMNYLLVTLGGWLFPLQQLFAVGTDPSLREMTGRLMHGMSRQAAGDGNATPSLHASKLQAFAKQAGELNDYLATHRQQVISEWILLAETLTVAGWGVLAAGGDHGAAVSAAAGVVAVGAHGITTAQVYNQNYQQSGSKPEPTRLGLPNSSVFAALGKQVGRLPPSVNAALPGLSLAASQTMMAPAVLRGLEQGKYMEAAGAAGIMLGLGVLYSGFLMPRVPQVLSRDDAARFRVQCGQFLESYFTAQTQSPRAEGAATAQEELSMLKKFAERLRFLSSSDRKELSRDVERIYRAAHPDTAEPRKGFQFGR